MEKNEYVRHLIKTCDECKGIGEVFNDDSDEPEFVTCENCNGKGGWHDE